jgi:hypothetical protein
MWNIGDKVAFFNIDEDFGYVADWKRYIEDDVSYYEIIDKLDDDTIIVQNLSQGRKIPVGIDEYLIHSKQTLKEHFESLNNKHTAICNKIKQLYRKHNNNHGSMFRFQGV